MVALLDTSVVIDLDEEEVYERLPAETAICTITLAELAAGPYVAADPVEQAKRQFRSQQMESKFSPYSFDADAARCYAQIVAAVVSSGWSHRSRVTDLMIAAIALANRFDLYTRNGEDFTAVSRGERN